MNRNLKEGRTLDIGACEDVLLLAATFSGSLIDIASLRLFSVYRNIQNSSRGSISDFTSIFFLASDIVYNLNTRFVWFLVWT